MYSACFSKSIKAIDALMEFFGTEKFKRKDKASKGEKKALANEFGDLLCAVHETFCGV